MHSTISLRRRDGLLRESVSRRGLVWLKSKALTTEHGTCCWCSFFFFRTQKCEPERTELVYLYFYERMNTVNNMTGGNNVEVKKLRFLNHTKCACKSINYKPRNLQPTRSPIKTYITERPQTNHQNQQPHHHRHHSERSTLYGSGKTTRHDIHQKCKNVIKHCPEPFVKRFREVDRRCVCECFSSSWSKSESRSYDLCQRIKSGTAQLEETWARCVRNASCAKPECNINFDYSAEQSRCLAMLNAAPKKHQQHRAHQYQRHHHRHRRHQNHLQQVLQSLQSRHHHHHHNQEKLNHQKEETTFLEEFTDNSDSDLQHHLSPTDWSTD